MIKKFFVLIFSIILSFTFFNSSEASSCNFNNDFTSSLEWCVRWNENVIQPPSGDLKVESGFKTLLEFFIENIATVLALLAIWSIAYGSMVIVASWWNDDKISKWKKIIIWALVWFLALVSANGIIRIIVYFIYWLD